MLKVEISIDCKQTEKAIKGLSCIMGKPISELLKDFLDINNILFSIAKAIKEKPEEEKLFRETFGDAPVDDLLEILL